MLLADYAQVADGKLTVVGGGWSLTGPDPTPFGIAILVHVPWDQANRRHVLRLELVDADGLPVTVPEGDDGDEAPVVFLNDVEFEVGRPAGIKPGTPLELPLAVSVAQLLLVSVGGELFGVPLHKVLLTTEYDLLARGGEGFESRSLVVAGQLVRAYGLAKLFGLPSLAPPGPRPFLVMEVDGARFALSVDRLIGQEEVVLKPLFPPLDRVRGISGVTVLANGRPLLVLDPRGLHELATTPDAPSGKGLFARGAA